MIDADLMSCMSHRQISQLVPISSSLPLHPSLSISFPSCAAARSHRQIRISLTDLDHRALTDVPVHYRSGNNGGSGGVSDDDGVWRHIISSERTPAGADNFVHLLCQSQQYSPGVSTSVRDALRPCILQWPL
ncbi:hypothetical protein BDA96_10G227400 [Sorghum bicolor]|uniref:Uncharacterized protein n=2 Tax=Sorghum bicolor TaxID=4558 RepID=A0A921Q6P1_SORBI|nr:hypothetical protein BDA96_10G227400 [Sorghum bicolor]OQU76600.1 hypothetical protein SORBI_3010G172633 [Sorghum bicolor]